MCNTTQYGCCEDGLTPAHGLHQAGCPTHSSIAHESTVAPSYDDHIRIPHRVPYPYPRRAVPQHSQRIETCADSVYGCCMDGSTVAEGENFDGCAMIRGDFEGHATSGCAESSYGCCPDGRSVAQDSHGLGCSSNISGMLYWINHTKHYTLLLSPKNMSSHQSTRCENIFLILSIFLKQIIIYCVIVNV